MGRTRIMPKNLLFYLVLILLFGIGIYAILHFGSRLEPNATAEVTAAAPLPAPASESGGAVDGLARGLAANVRHPLSVLLLQVIVIVAAARALGALFARIHQPAVIGEIVAGILLGPSLLGLVAPWMQEFLFPAASLGNLQLLSQVGVILFMFVVGIELDVSHLLEKAHAAVLVSHASILVPFLLGTAAALLLYPTLAPAGAPFTAFALFLGVATSITAFPVLARILEERRMANTPLGNTAIACAAVGDVTAWCLLALVVALARADRLGGSLLTILLVLLFIAAMLFVVRPLAARLVGKRDSGRQLGNGLLAGVFLFALSAALFTEITGFHALFGAFVAGVCMPNDAGLRGYLRERLEAFSSVFLLPLFFAFTGLRMEIGLLADWRSWLVCAGIIAMAIAGKLGGTMLAALWTGVGWGDSFALGVLMNARGLVELIVLNVGYDLGILSAPIFAMLVLMALVTTFMTAPLLHVLEVLRRRFKVTAARRAGPLHDPL
jgi:Kef-type K+ transport system membrane component KefB